MLEEHQSLNISKAVEEVDYLIEKLSCIKERLKDKRPIGSDRRIDVTELIYLLGKHDMLLQLKKEQK